MWRRLVLPAGVDRWSLTSLQQRLVKTGGRLFKHTPLLLVALGRGSSDAAAVWWHAQDRDDAVASRKRRSVRAEQISVTTVGRVSVESIGKPHRVGPR
jgi:hypothetical protein